MAKLPLAHILIVEDDSELLEVLQFVLEDGGYEVTVASNGADALETIGDKPVDLVILEFEWDERFGCCPPYTWLSPGGRTRPNRLLYPARCWWDEAGGPRRARCLGD